ncbi:MAG: hypothetical protein V3V08_08345 [Nannocystaceae bacterium]
MSSMLFCCTAEPIVESGRESEGDSGTPHEDSSKGSDDETASEDDDDSTDGSESDVGSGSDEEIDCDALPTLPLEYETIATRGAEDFAFDAEGYLVVVDRDSSNLFKQTYDGSPELVVANIGAKSSAGTAILPNGDIVVADEAGSIFRISLDGGVSTIVENVGANGITVGNDGNIYAASYWGHQPGLLRVDPASGEATWLFGNDDAQGVDEISGYDGVTLATGYASVFVNEGEWFMEGEGRVFELEFQDDGSVVQVGAVAPLTGSSGTLDGMATDVCGNLYIAVSNLFGDPECVGSGTFRVSPEGMTELVACFGNEAYTPSLNFGSGVGGWHADHLYVIDWLGELYEIPVGVPGKPEPHLGA